MSDALIGLPIPISFRKLYINGAYTESHSQQTLSIYNPKDDTLVATEIPIADAYDVDLAVTNAETAFNGPWASFTASQRAECFYRLADLLDKRLPMILRLDSLTTGNPVSLIPTREKGYIRNCLLYYAGWTDKMRGDYYPADDGFVKLVRHEPLGVCAAINPFNSPVASLFIKAAPCLATGNVLIIKPSEKSPLGSLAVGPLFEEAGFPPGVVQVLTGDGSTGALLARHMRVRKISFTGSIATGKKIQVAAAESNLKRVTLELGGKSPAVVFDDADLKNAVDWTLNGILARSGQVCVASSRIYVQKSIANEFIKQYTERMKAAATGFGDPQIPETKYGPLADSPSFERVQGMIMRGKKEADLVVGGNRIGDVGCFIEPTVFLNPKDDAEIYRNEVFGPVAVIKSFDTEEEVVSLANDTEYGLMAGVFTKDINRALRVSQRIDSGVVGINCISVMNIQAPFGGKKASGYGREFGEYALRVFTEPKTILIK
ncbi:aldehyde dehydrogenase domain-containing protein [Talaromyces proteolyticus]|uniref:aldehyde dehydrogenase (NAD(+)) n=1 Tax=Talaromyces proteolyticus TaxID=1131652 RepID=A0AAD4PY48_9EURO|nr:aldehyde dehydrogenase domain-containing protein [Talaromyces proteolyticus]KAH8700745.1 aldehyde dehydrogenase domain-containing protein [Talaromyces proteolyticus]